ncbi:hypothetical protein Pyn_16901 [Prunus yedoensis var. nudiflora]|uniref:Uncharacterized protein n=1 Tax=Prunus yedoensis var. nudiflora TaxID=2094558 RepID=A0A314ZQ60_PRUYE|nr:hypothetical protein Pyn_16901 [Prunus yedoensis var. nudiflora]
MRETSCNLSEKERVIFIFTLPNLSHSAKSLDASLPNLQVAKPFSLWSSNLKTITSLTPPKVDLFLVLDPTL